MTLEDKLALIIEDIGEYSINQKRYSKPMEHGELTFAEQIKQAFLDAGWLPDKYLLTPGELDYIASKQPHPGAEGE